MAKGNKRKLTREEALAAAKALKAVGVGKGIASETKEIDLARASELLSKGKIEEVEKKIPEKIKKELEEAKKKLKEFKKKIIKKFPYIDCIGILPPEASRIVEEEENVKKEKEEKLIHLIILVPNDKTKMLGKIEEEAIQLVKDIKPKVWVHVKMTKELWELCFDSKYSLVEAISMSFPLHDRGILGALRLANIHKILVLRKFERYVVSYVIAGSLVREEAKKVSDVDVYVVIDDTDVKRMSRMELKEKLRALIYSYALEAGERSGIKNKLNVQIYILTEFWEAVKDAHPVIFTLIRDGVPLYDKGAFMPWKLLLKMGKIKPSPEAIDLFMSLGERVAKRVKKRLNDIATEDIYWGVLTPSQAALMLYGLAPPTSTETVELMRKVFVEKEKLLEQKYVDILKKVVGIYKKYEHEELKTISGKEIDTLVKESEEYITRLKQLMKQIEKKASGETTEQLHTSVFEALKNVLGKASEASLITKFEKELVAKGKIPPISLSQLRDVIKARKDLKKGKIMAKHDVDVIRKKAYELIRTLTEYAQRRELIEAEKKRVVLLYKKKEKEKILKKEAELFIFQDAVFIIPDISSSVIKKLVKNKLEESSREELEKYIKEKKIEKKITQELLDVLKKEFGDFELVL